MCRWYFVLIALALSCGGGGQPARDASADRILVGGTVSAASSSAGNAGSAGTRSGGATGGSISSKASSSTIACLYADCHSDRYRCASSSAYQRVRTVYCDREGSYAACGSATCGTRCVDDGDPVSCPADMTCVDVYGRDPGYACQPDSGMAGRDGSAGGTTPATTSSGGVGGQRSSSDSGMGNSGGTTASASSAWCTAGDCFNITYQCLDSENGYQRLKTVYCANEKSAACGSATCGTRCVKDGDPILCPAGTSCQLVYRGTGIRWTTPEDACQPLPDGGMSLLDAGLMDGAAKDTRSN